MRPVDLTIERSNDNAFDRRVAEAATEPLRAAGIDTFQVNIGLECNLACRHCHVESSPHRTERMSWRTMQQVLDAMRLSGAATLDLTGGAPEMHPHFRQFIAEARAIPARVIVRTNLTILLADGYRDLPAFFREHRVHLIASLPCYLLDNVNKQRGLRVYEQSIDAIRMLNEAGYGIDPALPLDLVYNPLGPHLPPAQHALESDYRRELHQRFAIRFTRLITITNMPIGRFLHDLKRDGAAARYEQLLRDAFNPATIDGLMCRRQVHVSHDGTLHDCDFNYALQLPCGHGAPRHIAQFDPVAVQHRRIVTGDHCFGCTAGSGSSCGGALV